MAENPPRGTIPHDPPPPGRLQELLAAGALVAYDGRRSPETGLAIGLTFGTPRQAADTLADYAHLDDWLQHRPWPPGLLPFAWLCPETAAEEARWFEANVDETEVFFAAATDEPGCPVFLWSLDAGFERIAPSLDAFLAGLVPNEDEG